MRGNGFSGGLGYAPSEYTERVNPADVARWTNTESVTTHTATQENGLWDVEVGPGEAGEHVLVSGTHRYACRIHPEMRGTFAVTPFAYAQIRPTQVVRRVKIKSARKRKRLGRRHKRVRKTVFKRSVRSQWGIGEQAANAFDVERRVDGGPWQPWLTATTTTGGEFRARRDQVWEIRARERLRDDTTRGSDWSPPAPVVVD